MGPIRAVKSALEKSFDFAGRAPRSEFWWFLAFLCIIQFGSVNADRWSRGETGINIGVYFGLGPQYPWWLNIFTALFGLPFMSVIARRCQDIGIAPSRLIIFCFCVSAAFLLAIKAVPTGSGLNIILIVFILTFLCSFLFLTLKKSEPGTNAFGPNPNEVPS